MTDEWDRLRVRAVNQALLIEARRLADERALDQERYEAVRGCLELLRFIVVAHDADDMLGVPDFIWKNARARITQLDRLGGKL